jgi:hypothetical protein
MDADFVVLNVDPVEAPPEELPQAKVCLTVVAGLAVQGELGRCEERRPGETNVIRRSD